MGGGAMLTPVTGGGGLPPDPLLAIPRPTTTAPNHHSHHPSSSFHLSASAKQSVDRREDKRAIVGGSYYDSIFGSAPSRTEVEKALFDLQRFTLGYGSTELDWLGRALNLYDPRMLKSLGYGRVDDAFHLLQTEPSVQKMVSSISSDRAVWDALLNNEAVQNLRKSLSAAKEEKPQSSKEEPDLAALIVNWILDITKAVILQLIENFSSLVSKIFQPSENKILTAETSSQVDKELRSSVLLSIVILLIVVVTRAHGAQT